MWNCIQDLIWGYHTLRDEDIILCLQPANDQNTALIPQDNDTSYNRLFHLGLFHFMPAICLTLGRVFIGAGMSAFNFENTTESFEWQDTRTIEVLAYIIMLSSAADTLLGRGTSNFLRCLPPEIYISNTALDENISIVDFDQRFPMTALKETYVIAPTSNENNNKKLYKRENDAIKAYSFSSEDAQEILNNLFLTHQNDPDNSAIILSVKEIQAFYRIKNKQDLPAWSLATQILYWNIYIPAASTAFFSSIAAILYLYTFATKFDKSVEFYSAFIAFGFCVNLLTYCYFNIRSINKNTTDMCQSFENGNLLTTIFNTPYKPLALTISLAILGMVGNLSAAYYVMFKFFELPAALTLCDSLHVSKNTISMMFSCLNVYGSFYSGIFNMAVNAHKIITKPKKSTCNIIDTVVSINTLINATINALQSFLGTAKLMNQNSITFDSLVDILLFSARVLICLGYVYLTFGMMRDGNERSIQYLSQCNFFQPNKDKQYEVLSSTETNAV